MSYRDKDLLRSRSQRMLVSARNSLSIGDYDIAALMAEQALQLFLKSKVFEVTGEIPVTHGLRELLSVIGDLMGRAEETSGFIRRNRSLLIRLEDAYIISRYVPRVFEKEEAEELVEFAGEATGFVESLEKEG